MCDFHKNGEKCNKLICYGNYCKKHKREHLVANNFIIINNFTGKSSDYLKDDILSTLNDIDKKKHNRLLKKDELFTCDIVDLDDDIIQEVKQSIMSYLCTYQNKFSL